MHVSKSAQIIRVRRHRQVMHGARKIAGAMPCLMLLVGGALFMNVVLSMHIGLSN